VTIPGSCAFEAELSAKWMTFRFDSSDCCASRCARQAETRNGVDGDSPKPLNSNYFGRQLHLGFTRIRRGMSGVAFAIPGPTALVAALIS
jgi:hypothetical protein